MDPSPQPGQPSGPTLLRQDLLKLPPPSRWEIPPIPPQQPKASKWALPSPLDTRLPSSSSCSPRWAEVHPASAPLSLPTMGTRPSVLSVIWAPERGEWAGGTVDFSPPLDGAPWPGGKAPHSWASTSSPFLRAGLLSTPVRSMPGSAPPPVSCPLQGALSQCTTLQRGNRCPAPCWGLHAEDAAGMGLSGGPGNREVLSALLGRLRPHAGPVAISMQ